jgi:hypothetical protein
VNDLIATGANILYVIYDARTVMLEDGMEYSQIAYQFRCWQNTCGIEAIRDWLFAQVKSTSSSTILIVSAGNSAPKPRRGFFQLVNVCAHGYRFGRCNPVRIWKGNEKEYCSDGD